MNFPDDPIATDAKNPTAAAVYTFENPETFGLHLIFLLAEATLPVV